MAEETRVVLAQIVSITFDANLKNLSGKEYVGCEVIYKNDEGKLVTKVFANTAFNFNKTLHADLEALKPGDYAELTMVKKGNFVNLVSADKADAPAAKEPTQAQAHNKALFEKLNYPAPAASPTREAVKSNYETPAERAARQVMIVRQSSLTAALKLAELGQAGGGDFIPDEAYIIESAKVFEAYVLGTDSNEVKLPE